MDVLLVEDDFDLVRALSRALTERGFRVLSCADGAEALVMARKQAFSAIVLDLSLPGLDGLHVLQRLRRSDDLTPVLILTARGAVGDRVAGLNAGADDYLVKPFDLAELSARIGSVARRYSGNPNPIITHGPLDIDLAARTVRRGGRPVQLTAREWALLEAFLTRPGQLLSKAQLEEKLYGWGEEIESNAVEVFVHHLRRKLSAELIRTVRGVGYMIPKAAE